MAERAEPRLLTAVSDLIDMEESLRDSGRRWAFRGQPQAFGTLAPSFQRELSKQSFGTAEIIEHRLIEGFRQHYEKLPDRSADMPDPLRIGYGYDLRCLSVMQHYEIPTRLLDWTSNFWTAIYFACAGDPGITAELWCYDRELFVAQRQTDPSLESLLDASYTPPPEPAFLKRRDPLLVELDPRMSPRMVEQQAHHTVAARVVADHVPLLYELADKTDLEKPSVQRFLIDGNCKVGTLRFLADELNIMASTIFPDVVGLGRFLRWQFESLRSMLLPAKEPVAAAEKAEVASGDSGNGTTGRHPG